MSNRLRSSLLNSLRQTSRKPRPYRLSVTNTVNNTIVAVSTTPNPLVQGIDGSLQSDSSSPFQPGADHVVARLSAGASGFKGANRSTYDAGVQVALDSFKLIQEMCNRDTSDLHAQQRKKKLRQYLPPTEIELVLKGFGKGREAFLHTLQSDEGAFVRGLIKRVTDKVSNEGWEATGEGLGRREKP